MEWQSAVSSGFYRAGQESCKVPACHGTCLLPIVRTAGATYRNQPSAGDLWGLVSKRVQRAARGTLHVQASASRPSKVQVRAALECQSPIRRLAICKSQCNLGREPLSSHFSLSWVLGPLATPSQVSMFHHQPFPNPVSRMAASAALTRTASASPVEPSCSSLAVSAGRPGQCLCLTLPH